MRIHQTLWRVPETQLPETTTCFGTLDGDCKEEAVKDFVEHLLPL